MASRWAMVWLGPVLIVGCAHGVNAQATLEPHASASSEPQSSQASDPNQDRDAFRNTPPPQEAAPGLHVSAPEVLTLDNGMQVWVYPKRDLPLVQVVALIKSGSAQDPRGQEGLAALTAEVMRRGTHGRTAQAIALEIETLGGQLDVSVHDDATVFQVGALTENIGPVMDVLADVLRNPTFDRGEFERAQKQHLTELVQMQSAPQACARTVFRKVVFGTHPYGSNGMGTTKSVRGLRPHGAAQFFAKHVRPHNMRWVIVGDVSVDEAKAMVASRLGEWHGGQGSEPAPATPHHLPREIALVNKPGPLQSQLIVGGLGLSRHAADYDAAILANAVLGGQFASRLNMNLREDKGWTYGVHSDFIFLRALGPFSINTRVTATATSEAIAETFKEIARMRNEEITQKELDDARNTFTLSLPAKFESLGHIAAMISTLVLNDLPTTYYQQLPEALAKVSTQDVLAVMRKIMQPEHLSVVVVGDGAALQKPLSALNLGPVRLRDSEGNIVAPEKIKLKAATK